MYNGGASGRGGRSRPTCPTPDRSATKCSGITELRRLAAGGRPGRHPRSHAPSDCGWNKEMLNIKEGCVECVDNDTLEYDPMYQRLRLRRSASAANALRKTREAWCDGKCVLEGNRLVDVKNLSSFLTNKTACRPCATRAAVHLACQGEPQQRR